MRHHWILFCTSIWGGIVGYSCLAFGTTELNLRQFVQLAEKNDPELRKILKKRDRIQFVVDLGLPSRAFTLTSESRYGMGIGTNQNTFIFSSQIRKDILETGSSLNFYHDRTTRPDRTEDVTRIQIEQSLFRNFLGRDLRFQKSSLEAEEEAIRLEVEEDYETYIYQISALFLEYQQALSNQKIAEILREQAKELHSFVRSKHKSKIATNTDLKKSELQVLLSEEDLISRRQELLQSAKKIEAIIAEEIALDQVVRGAETKLKQFSFYPLKDVSTLIELESLRVLRIARLREEISRNKVELSKRGGRPEINLIGGYSIDNSIRFSTPINRQEAVIGINLEIPIWDSQNRAAVLEATLESEQQDLSLQAIRIQTEKNLQAVRDRLQELDARIEVARKKDRLSRQIVIEETNRYRFGKVSLDQLIEYRRIANSSGFEYRYAVLEYNKAYLYWLHLNDQLIEYRDYL